MTDVSHTPSFPGQLSVAEEKRTRLAILEMLHRYASGTGAMAGDNVVEWFRQQLAARPERAATGIG